MGPLTSVKSQGHRKTPAISVVRGSFAPDGAYLRRPKSLTVFEVSMRHHRFKDGTRSRSSAVRAPGPICGTYGLQPTSISRFAGRTTR